MQQLPKSFKQKSLKLMFLDLPELEKTSVPTDSKPLKNGLFEKLRRSSFIWPGKILQEAILVLVCFN